jgi:hypothetical protein
VAYAVVDMDTGERLGEALGLHGQHFQVVAERRLLCLDATPGDDRALHLLDPVTGQARPVEWPDAPQGRDLSFSVLGWRPDGRALVSLWERRTASAWLQHLLLLDAATGRAQTIARGEVGSLELLDHDEQTGTLVVEAERRIVRLGPGAGQREVLWPR